MGQSRPLSERSHRRRNSRAGTRPGVRPDSASWEWSGKSERRRGIGPKPSPMCLATRPDAFLNLYIPPEGDSRPSLHESVAPLRRSPALESARLPAHPCRSVLSTTTLAGPRGKIRLSLCTPIRLEAFTSTRSDLHSITRYTQSCIIDPSLGARVPPGPLRPPL